MKKYIKFASYNLVLLSITFLLIGCSDHTNEEEQNDSATNNTAETDEMMDTDEDNADPVVDNSSKDPRENESDDNSSNNSQADEENENNHALSSYSSEEIEYARIWLQLGPNQEIDGLYVKHIPSGTPLDPSDEENDVSYPEDVIQLSGSRTIDGMITYSGNGDGTINVYKIPYGNRWYGGTPRPDDIDLEDAKEEMRDTIENTESVYIDPGTDEEVIDMIEKIHMVE